MRRSVGGEPPQSLLPLPLGPDSSSAPGLIGEHDGMDEALEEVAFLGRGGPPRRLECLVRLEVGAGPGKRQAVPVRLGDLEVECVHGGILLAIRGGRGERRPARAVK